MTHRSTATYVLIVGIVIMAAGAVLMVLPGPGLFVFAPGFVVTAVAVALLLNERSAAKVAPHPGPTPDQDPPAAR